MDYTAKCRFSMSCQIYFVDRVFLKATTCYFSVAITGQPTESVSGGFRGKQAASPSPEGGGGFGRWTDAITHDRYSLYM